MHCLFVCSCRSCVHRDLAARNILVHKHPSGDMEAKIADFGLSRYVHVHVHIPNKHIHVTCNIY